MNKTDRRRPLTKQDRIWWNSDLPGTCGGESGTGIGVSPGPPGIPSVLFHQRSTQVHSS